MLQNVPEHRVDTVMGRTRREKKKVAGMQSVFHGGGGSKIPARPRGGSAHNMNLKL